MHNDVLVPSSAVTADQPVRVQVETTSSCNLKCRMCPLTLAKTLSSNASGHMRPDVWENVLHACAGTGEVLVCGFGEAMLDPQFLLRLAQLDAIGVGISFATNGTLVKDYIVGALNRLSHLLQINVSIDSLNKDAYRRIRGGKLSKALDGLKRLAFGLDDPGVVSVSTVVTHDNVESLVLFPKFLSGIGLRRLTLQGLQGWNPDLMNENLLYHADSATHIQAIRDACRIWGVGLEISDRLRLEHSDRPRARDLYHPKKLLNQATQGGAWSPGRFHTSTRMAKSTLVVTQQIRRAWGRSRTNLLRKSGMVPRLDGLDLT